MEYLPPWCWLCDTHHGNHQRLQAINDRNIEGTDAIKEVQQHMKPLKARDCEGIDEVNELKRELKGLKELKASFKLKCIALFFVLVCFVVAKFMQFLVEM